MLQAQTTNTILHDCISETRHSDGGQTAARRHVSRDSSSWIAISQIDIELLPHI